VKLPVLMPTITSDFFYFSLTAEVGLALVRFLAVALPDSLQSSRLVMREFKVRTETYADKDTLDRQGYIAHNKMSVRRT